MLAAVAVIALAMGLIGLWLGPLSKPPPRNPFGMGLREATPSGSLGAWILSVQSGFYASLQAGVREMKENGSALYSLLLVGFAYGVFHAAGPGHGKGVFLLVDGEGRLCAEFAHERIRDYRPTGSGSVLRRSRPVSWNSGVRGNRSP